MKRKLLIALFALGLAVAWSQTYQSGSDAEPIINPLRSNYIPNNLADRMVDIRDLAAATCAPGQAVTLNSAGTQFECATVMGGGGTGLDLPTVLAAIMPGSGIAIDRSTAGQITISYDPGPISDHNRYAVWTPTATTPTAAQFTAADTSTSGTITVRATPGGTSSFLHFADTNSALSDIRETGSAFNSRGLFVDTPAQILIGGTTHYVYSTRFAVHSYAAAQDWTLTP